MYVLLYFSEVNILRNFAVYLFENWSRSWWINLLNMLRKICHKTFNFDCTIGAEVGQLAAE